MPFYIGLMSGTSADGIDAALVEINPDGVSVVDTEFLSHPDSTRQSIQSLQLNRQAPYHQVAELDIELGEQFAHAANILASRNPDIKISAIGCHGQTIQHRPDNTLPYTLQIGKGAVIAERTGITVVNDFRARDLALGGQGAPLAPAFHRGVFSDNDRTIAIVNIGGISNISLLVPGADPLGFDCGPGNTLMDLWCQQHFGARYDKDGELARNGKVDHGLLESLLDDDYFAMAPPKSTGQEYFNHDWLVNNAGSRLETLNQNDVLATLTMLSATSIASALQRFGPNTQGIYICGGGAQNPVLLEMLEQQAGQPVSTTGALGIHPDWVEACAFAWLAQQTLEHKSVDLGSITGSSKPCLLGCIWPA